MKPVLAKITWILRINHPLIGKLPDLKKRGEKDNNVPLSLCELLVVLQASEINFSWSDGINTSSFTRNVKNENELYYT